jgi:diguanylate cyclase (GGDEF)-like protein
MHCSQQDAIKKAEQIRQQIALLHFDKFSITASIGVACLTPGASTEFKGLFEQADSALYRAKENGRNRIELHNAA